MKEVPITVDNLLKSLGLLRYYRQLIKDFPRKGKQLYDILSLPRYSKREFQKIKRSINFIRTNSMFK